MKNFILIAVIAALTVCNNAASIPNEVAPGQEEVVVLQESTEVYQKDYNLEGGTAGPFNDVEFSLFYEESFNLPAIPHKVQIRDVVFFGNSTAHIDRITVTNPPISPGSISLGVYWTSYGNVRVTSAPGMGLRCTVRFLGHYTDWV